MKVLQGLVTGEVQPPPKSLPQDVLVDDLLKPLLHRLLKKGLDSTFVAEVFDLALLCLERFPLERSHCHIWKDILDLFIKAWMAEQSFFEDRLIRLLHLIRDAPLLARLRSDDSICRAPRSHAYPLLKPRFLHGHDPAIDIDRPEGFEALQKYKVDNFCSTPPGHRRYGSAYTTIAKSKTQA